MRKSRNNFFYRLKALIPLILLLAGANRVCAIIDSNTNGMSDVWEQIYGAVGIDPNADSDGDGFPNILESIAGTNPFDSTSYPQFAGVALSGTNLVMNVPAAAGKMYQLQSCTSLGGGLPVWVNETNVIAQPGVTTLSFPAPTDLAGKFFRVVISDANSQGDGLTDWEAYKLGLDPLNLNSNGHQDSNGQPISDYQYAVSMMATQNVVSIVANDSTTVQPDAGQSPTDLGQFTVSRSGFGLDLIVVNVGHGGPGAGFAVPTVDYVNNLPISVTLPPGTLSKTISVTPLANTNLQVPVITQLNLLPGTGYSVGAPNTASVVIYPSPTASGLGLTGNYYTNASTNYLSITNFNSTNLFLTRVDPAVDFNWTNGTSPNLSNGVYCVRWTGQIEPQYSETYVFDVNSDDGAKLWVNDQLLIDKWVSQGATDWTNAIALQANTRYNIKLEYLQTGGKAQAHLSWYSSSQPKQVIPSNRLYPTNGVNNSSSNAPSVVTSALTAFGFVGQPFSFTVTGANTPLGFTATNLPPGLSFNITNGAITGVPLLAGSYSVPLTASNSVGVGASALNITIFNTGSSVVREVWTNAPGVNISDIPLNTPASSIGPLGGLEGITDFGDNYGERIRGYFTAPVTGNYYFWVAGSDSAQVWISNNGESVNKVLRAWVAPTNNPTSPGHNGTTTRQWNVQASQKSGWLSMVAGQKYYIEVLHKAGVGANDNWSVGWLQDPMGTNTIPAGVTPGYLVSRYYPPLPVNIPGTLYSANMLALPGINSDAVGSASLRLSADGSKAILNYSINNLAGTHVDHIYSDPYLNYPTTLLFDIAAAHPQPDGSYVWPIKPTGALGANDILEIINENK
ncbi:MAG TPA: PA14 domain-containing protein, partial [Verrucomicrobiae bacterium]